jgi:hypothetical protein
LKSYQISAVKYESEYPEILGKFKYCGFKLVLTDVSTPRQKKPENYTSKQTLKQRNLGFFKDFKVSTFTTEDKKNALGQYY